MMATVPTAADCSPAAERTPEGPAGTRGVDSPPHDAARTVATPTFSVEAAEDKRSPATTRRAVPDATACVPVSTPSEAQNAGGGPGESCGTDPYPPRTPDSGSARRRPTLGNVDRLAPSDPSDSQGTPRRLYAGPAPTHEPSTRSYERIERTHRDGPSCPYYRRSVVSTSKHHRGLSGVLTALRDLRPLAGGGGPGPLGGSNPKTDAGAGEDVVGCDDRSKTRLLSERTADFRVRDRARGNPPARNAFSCRNTVTVCPKPPPSGSRGECRARQSSPGWRRRVTRPDRSLLQHRIRPLSQTGFAQERMRKNALETRGGSPYRNARIRRSRVSSIKGRLVSKGGPSEEPT